MSTKKEEQAGMVHCYIGHHSVLISCKKKFHLLGGGSSVGMGKSDKVTLPLALKADEVTLPLVLKAGMTSVFRQVMGEGGGHLLPVAPHPPTTPAPTPKKRNFPPYFSNLEGFFHGRLGV